MDIKEELKQLAKKCRNLNWTFSKWQPAAALYEREEGGLIYKYRGEEFDEEIFELVEGGWGQDHCLFCGMLIGDPQSQRYLSEGFTDGFEWICPTCYQNIIVEKKDP